MNVGTPHISDGVLELMNENTIGFNVLKTIVRYSLNDWGDTEPEAQAWNNDNLSSNGMICAKYKIRDNYVYFMTDLSNKKVVTRIMTEFEYLNAINPNKLHYTKVKENYHGAKCS